MKRNTMKSLLEWKSSSRRKPLLLMGARQVGKTWLMKEFGRQHFANVAYINFDEDDAAKRIFNGDFDISRIITALQLKSGQKIVPGETLLIFDEVQEAPRVVTSLKYFHENAPEYFIVAAGSLLGVASLEGTGFPVGKVDMLDLYPMTFTEFLNATGNERFTELLLAGDWEMIGVFKDKFIEYLRYYYFVGGMPEVVSAFLADRDFHLVRTIQKQLLDAYDRDFSKHAPDDIVPRIRLVWEAIASQLAKENRKFIYGALRKNARANDFELAIQWLKDAGLVYTVPRIAKPDMPLSAYQDTAFKMFMVDVGLLGAQSNLDAQSILDGNRIFEEFKGALTEQYVLQQLIAECDIKPFYWSAENSSGEVDFLFQHGSKVIPLEVKAAENLKARSLMFFSRKFKIPFAVRTSMADYRKGLSDAMSNKSGDQPFQFTLINLPLYGLSRIRWELGGS